MTDERLHHFVMHLRRHLVANERQSRVDDAAAEFAVFTLAYCRYKVIVYTAGPMFWRNINARVSGS